VIFTVALAPTEVGFTDTLVTVVVCAQAEDPAKKIKRKHIQCKRLKESGKKRKPFVLCKPIGAKERRGSLKAKNAVMGRNKL
jgi:hypothetical protein